MASDSTNQVTIVLGDEFDDALREKVVGVLRGLGAVQKGSSRALVGSQDFERFEVAVGGRELRVEAETYVGLSITGPEDLVQQVRTLVAS